jgi:hypothetical protein
MARLLDFIIFGVPRSGTRMRIPRAFSSVASATILRFVSDKNVDHDRLSLEKLW